ncbi:unnamed protein product, partial [Iphiclides podalirius]
MHYITLITSIACEELLFGGDYVPTSYDPGELLTKIFNLNGSTQGRSGNGVRFEGETNAGIDNTYADKDAEERRIYSFPPEGANFQYAIQHNVDNIYKITYADDNRPGEGQKTRRRRKPRLQRPPDFLRPLGPSLSQFAIRAPPYTGSDHQGPIYSPKGPSKPSLASEAVDRVTEALTSIALFDDLQCVPRLLCEAASDGALGSSQTLQSIAGVQPLLTLLSTYSGVSSNPLFVFGRAALLGMSSKNNSASCRYAYPLCPTDPEKLIYYLNNHNGGFFRFFNAPQRGLQNIGHLYDGLSQSSGGLNPFLHNDGADNNLYQQYEHNGIQDYSQQNYGVRFPYKEDKYGLLNNVRFKNNVNLNETYRIEKRIQNRPGKYVDSSEDLNFDDENYQTAKWSFPEAHKDFIKSDSFRVGKGLKFPDYVNEENDVNSIKRDPRGFVFPDTLNNHYLDFKKYQGNNLSPHSKYHNDFDANIYKVHNYPDGYDKEQSIRTVYVVRGNGDPRNPEIIKLRPGQSVH